ncbi:hypothetical protein P3X46_012260 [Hevea brasiliensis]|uniref:Uncharacterized protein n=1 Tax=Hevea brasiliensis TaxID=3981 RepID=A0ABQ9M9M9_HEVBR|nr:myb-related protein 308 [Hevea brasiliensis]KAJ9177004.1 hypothetical protein P3X46_012260 [Hevea brasiliensis]
MGRSPCCEKEHTNKGAWTKEEDERLINYIKLHGEGCWRSLPKAAGLLRCGKSCRLRWINYLRPDLKRGNFTEEEDELIIKLHSLLGNKWSLIAARLPGRTDNEIKNYWNTHIKRKLYSRGIDPQTHRPLNSAAAATATTTTTTASAALSNCWSSSNNNKNNKGSINVSKIETHNSLAQFVQAPECIGSMKICNSNIKVRTDSSAEDSNSSSGVTTEEVCPEINLELSIGLSYHQPQVSSINFIKQKQSNHHQQQHHHDQQQQPQQQNLAYVFSEAPTKAVCFCCSLGLRSNHTCSCRVMETSLTADSFSRYYRSLNS